MLYIGQMLYAVIGDSHCLTYKHPSFVLGYVGPATAHNLINPNSSNQSQQKILAGLSGMRDLPYLLVFGEIDCRLHVYRQACKHNRSVEDMVGETVARYRTFINLLGQQFPNWRVTTVVPPGYQSNVYNYDIYADWPTRLHITKTFNLLLRETIPPERLIDIYDRVVTGIEDPFAYRHADYVLDDVHLNNNIVPLVLEQLNG